MRLINWIVSFFIDPPKEITILIDCSGSMDPDTVIEIALSRLRALRKCDLVNIIKFDHEQRSAFATPLPFVSNHLIGSVTNKGFPLGKVEFNVKKHVIEFIKDVQWGRGGTDIIKALETVAKAQNTNSNLKVIEIISDGRY